MQLTLTLREGEPLGRQIFTGLRAAIMAGGLHAGERLPATRELAEQLGVSRTVVLAAYEQLVAEGFASGRRGSGTFVAAGFAASGTRRNEEPVRLSHYGARVARMGAMIDLPSHSGRRPRYDFAYGRGDVDTFPFERWRRLLLEQARRTSVRGLDYAAALGDEALRTAIATHLRRSRGVVCEAGQVIVVNGSQQALDLIVRVLIEPGDAVAIEDPQYQGTRAALLAGGAELRPVAVDEAGLDPALLPEDARALFLTPSHQFPTGAVLPLARRLAVLEWAARTGAVVVEDDYDGEFRYDGVPLESLQGLDTRGRVLYVGTFSRTVFAALRIGYLVVPPALVQPFATAKWLTDRHTASLEQRTLAAFIERGFYELYLRRLRRSLAARRAALLEAIGEVWGGAMPVTGAAAGAHVVLWPGGAFDEAQVIAAAAALDVGVYGVSSYYAGPAHRGLMLGYSQLGASDIREGIARLATVVGAR